MLIYPQLSSGALSQYPAMKRRTTRTILNSTSDGRFVKLIDAGAGVVQWQLHYTGLSDAELAALQQFFVAAEGSLNGFTFLDPSANLLSWSEVLSNSVWNAGPSLTLQGGIADPAGGSNGWQVTNAGAGPESLTQTLNAPAGYEYCFSVFARASQPTSITLSVGSYSELCPVETSWSRIAGCGSGDVNAVSIAFGLTFAAGSVIDLFGPQAEAQGSPSTYQTSAEGGVYANARFRDDALSFTTLAPNCHAVTVNVYYANHL